MKTRLKQFITTPLVAVALLLPLLGGGAAHAITSPVYPTDSTAVNTRTTADNKRLAAIKTKGDAELARRLATLNKLLTVISNAAKLTQTSKVSLTNEVTDELTAITMLRTKLAAETTAADAVADVSTMVTEYRVYAFLAPKVQLIKAADDQQVAKQKLDDLATKLGKRLDAAHNAGKDVASLETKLDAMKLAVTTAQGLSSHVVSDVLPLQPSDYDHDHAILSAYRENLKTAHTNNQLAYNEAKDIVNALKNM